MGIDLILKGFIVGVSVSIPLGPIAALCVQRTINKGHMAGFFSGIGAALSDTLYAVIAGFSLSIIIAFIEDHKILFQVIGAIVLIVLGVKIFTTNPIPAFRNPNKYKSSLFSDLVSTFFITFSNPLALFAFIAMFAGFGLVKKNTGIENTFYIVSGVFLGACCWWFLITYVVNRFRQYITLRKLWWLNKILGTGIVLFVLVMAVVLIVRQ